MNTDFASMRVRWIAFLGVTALVDVALGVGRLPSMALLLPLSFVTLIVTFLALRVATHRHTVDRLRGEAVAHVDHLLIGPTSSGRPIAALVVLVPWLLLAVRRLFDPAGLDASWHLVSAALPIAAALLLVVPDGAARHVRFTSWGMATRPLGLCGGPHDGALFGRAARLLVGAGRDERTFAFAQIDCVRLDGTTLELVDVAGAIDQLDLSAIPVTARQDLVRELTDRLARAQAGLDDDPDAGDTRRSQVLTLAERRGS